MKDYYKILGLSKEASIDDIKMSYKKLAMKYHPDRNPNDPKSEEKFKDIKEAYEFLTNKNASKNNIGSMNVNNMNFSDFSNSESSLDDIFNVIFQKNFKKNNRSCYLLDIDLECAVYGCFLNLKIPYQGTCNFCFGKGYKPESDLKICNKCYGSGLYTVMQGIFNFKQKCSKCEGKGYISTESCIKCEGSGKLHKFNNKFIEIKKNTENNTSICLNLDNKDSENNNFYIIIKIKPHSIYFRKDLNNNDLYMDFYIDFIKIMLGGFLKIPTLYGFVVHKIDKCFKNFKNYKVGNFGLNFNKRFGNLYLNIFIDILSELNFYSWFLLNKLKISIEHNNYNLLFNFNKKINAFNDLVFKL
ncbi:molecular chaperone with C-terminal Zn finger domain protein [Candidatus Nasuia deltocephalinicola str. NAS-ALF]|uniref:Chaperone protein DnaJ n=1 Tax=Candidatus Nasuia deltocephalinicola str. NAS-ALF TaxID=1343077 RepID=S5SYA7_9PROT|nr:molecular chaperone with C-terminal Zn finger domain protein [Candidatus Nasuia deltocephalinicola str. NAS-ALF]